MSRGPRLLTKREKHMDRPSLRTPCAGPTGKFAGSLKGACDGVGAVVDGDPRRFEKHLRVKPPVEQKLSGIVASACECREQVGGRRLLPTFPGELFGGSAKRDERCFPGR